MHLAVVYRICWPSFLALPESETYSVQKGFLGRLVVVTLQKSLA